MTMPTTDSSTREARSRISAAASVPWTRAASAAVPSIINWRGTRSPSTPPARTVTTSAPA